MVRNTSCDLTVLAGGSLIRFGYKNTVRYTTSTQTESKFLNDVGLLLSISNAQKSWIRYGDFCLIVSSTLASAHEDICEASRPVVAVSTPGDSVAVSSARCANPGSVADEGRKGHLSIGVTINGLAQKASGYCTEMSYMIQLVVSSVDG
jgi:hypothetical protein